MAKVEEKLHIGKALPDMSAGLVHVPIDDQDGNELFTIPFDEHAKYVWVNGENVKVQNAIDHVLTYDKSYAGAVFSGERGYVVKDRDGEYRFSVLFRNPAHKGRFIYGGYVFNQFDNIISDIGNGAEAFPYTPAEFYKLAEDCYHNGKAFPYTLKAVKGRSEKGKFQTHEYTLQELVYATRQLMVLDDLGCGYIRPVLWVGGEGGLKIPTIDRLMHVAIAPLPWGRYLKEEHYETGLDVLIAPYPRIWDDMDVTRKIAANYVNSARNINIAKKLGFGEVLVLNKDGLVVEGSAENLFVYKDGVMYTPPVEAHILPGVTRDAVIHFLEDMVIPFDFKSFTKEELMSDKSIQAVILVGTGAQIIHVRTITDIPNLRESLDRATLLRLEKRERTEIPKGLARDVEYINKGERHPIVKQLKDKFDSLFILGTDEHKKYGERWLTPLYTTNEERGEMLRIAKQHMRPRGTAGGTGAYSKGDGDPRTLKR